MGDRGNLNSILPKPARYFPLEKGKYEVAPNLRALGTPFGNGEADSKLFQLDTRFPDFRASKLGCRKERLGKYYCEKDLLPEVRAAVVPFLMRRLIQEHPSFFRSSMINPKLTRFDCLLTQETFLFDNFGNLVESASDVMPPYSSALDALASQFQEDIAVTTVRPERGDWLSALHLCSPSHWAAEDKVGKGFVAVHIPIPGIERVNAAAVALVEASIRKGPYTRFVWGFATDDRLNHHPEAPEGINPVEWRGRSFKSDRLPSPFTVRIERQVVVGLPEVDAFLFTIHVSFIEGISIKENPQERELLRSGLLSMNADQLKYKGLTDSLPHVLAWL